MTIRDAVVNKFVRQLDRLIAHHKELKLAIHNKRNEAILESELTTQFVLQSAVLWESFLNDLILAYIEMVPTRALSTHKERVKQSVEGKFGKRTRRVLTFSLPHKITRATIISLLDRRSWNITSKDATALAKKASDLLSSQFAKNFALDSGDSEFFNYLIALRNFLSHYSSGSRDVLKTAIDTFSEPINVPLNAPLGKIGKYLKTDSGTGVSRAVFIVKRMKEIARKL